MTKKTEKPVRKIGRPSGYSEEIGEEICARVASGEDIMSICESEGMPAHTTLHKWRERYPKFGAAYARARALSGEAAEARIQRIMDDARVGKIDANTARVLIDAEKWLASKRAPRTHGDRVEVEHSGQGDQGVKVILSFGPASQIQAPAIEGEVIRPALGQEPVDLPSMSRAFSLPVKSL